MCFSVPSPAARERVPDRAGEGGGVITTSTKATALTPETTGDKLVELSALLERGPVQTTAARLKSHLSSA